MLSIGKLIVIEVSEDIVVCSSSDKKNVTIDIEGLAVRFEVGDEISYIEHGFCDICRNGEVIGGLTNYYTRLIK